MFNKRNIINVTPQQNTLEIIQGECVYKGINLLTYWDVIPDGDFLHTDNLLVSNWLSFLTQYNFIPVSEFYIATIYAYLADLKKYTVPHVNSLLLSDSQQQHDKVVRDERIRFMDDLKSQFCFNLKENILSVELSDGQNITDAVCDFALDKKTVQKFLNHRYVPNYINKQLKELVKRNTGLVVFLTNSSIDHNNPTIAFLLESNHQKLTTPIKMADIVVEDETDIFNSTLSLILEHNSLISLKNTLRDAIQRGEINVVPAINRENRIGYPLMKHLKRCIKKTVAENLSKNPLLCDSTDLEYQVMFRLTSYSFEEIFENGSALKEVVERHTREIGWRGLSTLGMETIANFAIRLPLIEEIVCEQRRVLAQRLSKSTLPLERILNPSGIFSEDGWVISKDDEQYALKHPEHAPIPICFKEVEKEVAQAFHNDLHYIHTPRTWKAYGFFLTDYDIPFSILAIEPVDRTYKKNALLLFGFDPRHCVEFTRLYSWPGVPKNVSSAIFGAMFSHLRRYEPRLEAAISAFMPSYASGLSMLTGGFNFPILCKQGVHYFSPKNFSGSLTMEHITNRRKDLHTVSSQSKLPLLPTIELIAPIKQPRFEPYLQLGTHMIQI